MSRSTAVAETWWSQPEKGQSARAKGHSSPRTSAVTGLPGPDAGLSKPVLAPQRAKTGLDTRTSRVGE